MPQPLALVSLLLLASLASLTAAADAGVDNFCPSDQCRTLARTLEAQQERLNAVEQALRRLLEAASPGNDATTTTTVSPSPPDSAALASVEGDAAGVKGAATNGRLRNGMKNRRKMNDLEDSVCKLRTSLKCSLPQLLDESYTLGSAPALSLSLIDRSLVVDWRLPAADCYEHLTDVLVRLTPKNATSASGGNASDAWHPIRRQCWTRGVDGRQMTALLNPASTGGPCAWPWPPLLHCTVYVVQMVPNFSALKGAGAQAEVVVPPERLRSPLLRQLQWSPSTATQPGLHLNWTLESEACGRQMTSMEVHIYRDDAGGNVTSTPWLNLSVPPTCWAGDAGAGGGWSAGLAASSPACPVELPTLEKCRRYRIGVAPKFSDRWTGAAAWIELLATSVAAPTPVFDPCPGLFDCGAFRLDGNRCIHPRWVCDHGRDCPDGRDELHCSRFTDCSGKFRCGRQCLPPALVCNGVKDCALGEDEKDCRGDCCHRMTAASDRFSVDPHMGPMATKCTYYIQVAAGRVVWLSFERFVTTEPVLVYDGGHASSRLLLNQTGCGAPASTASSTNSVTVVVPAGSSVDAYYTTSSPGSAFKDGCGGYIRDRGLLVSPHGVAAASRRCIWYIENQDRPNATLVLDNNMANQTSYSIIVYDGWGANALVISRQMDLGVVKDNVYSLSNRVRVHISAPGDPAANGTEAVYSWAVSSIDTAHCRYNVTGSSGTVTSPRYPEPYPDDADCRWSLSVDVGYRIRLLFAYLDLEPHRDALQVYDGATVYAPVLLSTVDAFGPLQSWTSTSNRVLLRLTTSPEASRSGFLLIWQKCRTWRIPHALEMGP